MKNLLKIYFIGGVLLVVLLGAALLATTLRYNAVQAQVDDDDRIEIEVDGRTRSFYVHTPPSHATRSADETWPVLIGLHGGGSSAAAFATYTAFSELGDANDMIIVYPNGITPFRRETVQTWNAGNCCGLAREDNVDDVAFVEAIIDYVVANYAADAARIYVTGHSNGGMMSYRIGCELSERVAGIAPYAGALNVDVCEPTAPLDVLIIHGTEDRNVRYEGGEPLERISGPRVDQSVAYAANFWASHNNCDLTPEVIEVDNVRTEVYAGCDGGSRVQVVSLVGGGHSWPGLESRPRPGADEPFPNYDASEEIVQFFTVADAGD